VPAESIPPQLPGWRDIGPVRIGNAAEDQQQHNIYSEFMVALHSYLAAVDHAPAAELAGGMHTLIRTLAENAI
jgi:hypothetical protein